MLALALSCFSLIGIVMAFNSVLPTFHTSSPSPLLALAPKYALVLLIVGVLVILVRKIMAGAHGDGGKRIKAKV